VETQQASRRKLNLRLRSFWKASTRGLIACLQSRVFGTYEQVADNLVFMN
jgi:hypothetical protein